MRPMASLKIIVFMFRCFMQHLQSVYYKRTDNSYIPFYMRISTNYSGDIPIFSKFSFLRSNLTAGNGFDYSRGWALSVNK